MHIFYSFFLDDEDDVGTIIVMLARMGFLFSFEYLQSLAYVYAQKKIILNDSVGRSNYQVLTG